MDMAKAQRGVRAAWRAASAQSPRHQGRCFHQTALLFESSNGSHQIFDAAAFCWRIIRLLRCDGVQSALDWDQILCSIYRLWWQRRRQSEVCRLSILGRRLQRLHCCPWWGQR